MPSPGITVEDVDAFSDVSNGSTISVGSATSGGGGHMPRPPSGGSKRSRSVQGRRSRVAKSPYSTQQLKRSIKQTPPMPTARNMWITALKNGTSSLSTENSPIKTGAGRSKQIGTSSRTRHFSDVVQVADLKNKNHVRSASMSASEPQMTSGGVAHKPQEDYYDEIIELKKIINALKAENNIINTKLRRVEGENLLKDRKMEDLLNSRKQPEDMRRTLTDKKGDTSAIVNSLKQKLHAVERTVKDKEAELSQLKRDMKMTNIEELEIQSETYYLEVQRLQLALMEMQQSTAYERTSSPRNHSLSKGKSPAQSLQRLTEENSHLRAENQGLKKDLLTAIESTSTGGKKISLKGDYADMNRGQLLFKIRELEEHIQESAEQNTRGRRDSLPEDKQHTEEPRRSSLSKVTEVPGRMKLKGTASQKLSQLQEREVELLEETEKQRDIIERLKQDRTHYRNVADDLREKLKLAEEELEILRQGKSLTSDRRQSTSSQSSTRRRSSIKETSIADNSRYDELDRMLEDFQQQRAAKTLQRQWRGYKGRKIEEKEKSLQEQRNQAAFTLQKNWRKHRQQAKRIDEDSREEAVTMIQAAWRGHVVRSKRLEKLDKDLAIADTEDAIVNIQSALRAHSARTRHQEGHESRERRSWGSTSHAYSNRSESDPEEDAVSSSRGFSISKRQAEPAATGLKRTSRTETQGCSTTDASHAQVIATASNPAPALARAKPASSKIATGEFATAQPSSGQHTQIELATAECIDAQPASEHLARVEIEITEHSSTEPAIGQLAHAGYTPDVPFSAILAPATRASLPPTPTKISSLEKLAPTFSVEETTYRAVSPDSDSDDDAVVIGRSSRRKLETREKKLKTKTARPQSASVVKDNADSLVESKAEKQSRKQRVKKETLKQAPENRGVEVKQENQDKADGSRRSMISAPRFSNISEQSDDDDFVVTSSPRTKSTNMEQRKKKSTFEVVDSDDDDDSDAIITIPRRSLDTGIYPQRPALTRSNKALDPSGAGPKEVTSKGSMSRPGLSRSTGRLNPSKNQEELESSRDEAPQRASLSRSKRPLSAEKPSSTGKDNANKGFHSSEVSGPVWGKNSAVSDDDSDGGEAVVTSKKTRSKTSGQSQPTRPSLTRKSPTSLAPTQRESVTGSLDNFLSSAASKTSSSSKSPRRRSSLFRESDDDDDDDDDIIVGSRKKPTSKGEGKSVLGKKGSNDSVASLWAAPDKGVHSSTKRKSDSESSSFRSSFKSSLSKNWGHDFEFEGPSRRPESQLDELF